MRCNSLRLLLLITLFSIISIAIYAQGTAWESVYKAGGTGHDYGYSVAVDNQGNRYVCGTFYNSATFGSISLTSTGNNDGFIAKLNAEGTWLWARKTGGTTANDECSSIVLHDNSYLYITGNFSGTATFGSTTLTSSTTAAFVGKMDLAGNWLWAVKASGTGGAFGRGIATDTSGNPYVTGYISGSVTFGTTSLTSNGGSIDAFVAKLTSSGTWSWVIKGGGTSTDYTNSIIVDSNSQCYVTGRFQGTADFGTSLTSFGGSDILVAAVSSSGAWLWAQKAGASSDDYGKAISIRNSTLYLTGGYRGYGVFGSTMLPNPPSAGENLFIAKISTGGVWDGAYSASSASAMYGNGIVIDNAGFISVVGTYAATATFGAYSIVGSSTIDIFVAQMAPSGEWNWCIKGGATSYTDNGYAICKDADENLHVTGNFGQTATFDSITLTSGGGLDVFVGKILIGLNPAVLVAPANAASNVPANTALQWAASAGVVPYGYRIFLGTNNPPTNIINGNYLSYVFSYTPVPALNYLTTYYWQIIPYFALEEPTNCPVWSFTTSIQAPNPAGLASPPNNGLNVDVGSTLNWQVPSGGGTPTGYRLYMGTNDPPTNIVNGTNLGNVTSYTPPSALTYNTHYYWKIIPFNGGGDAAWCPTWNFTTLNVVPQCATLTSPSNNGTNLPVNSILQWSPPGSGGIPTGYKLFLGTNNPPTNLVNGVDLGNVLSYTPTANLSYHTQHYWKIVPYNAVGDATNCPVWSFTTIDQTPNAAGVSSPSNGSANIPITTSLNWTTPIGGGAPTGYKLYLGTNNPPSNMVNGTNLGNVLTYTPASNLSNLTHYYWKIVPFNIAGDASECPVWDFTCADILPLAATLVSPPNNGTNLPVSSVLQWSAPSSGGTPTGYKLYLGTNNPPTNLVNGFDLGNVLSYTPTTSLSYNTQHYWKIVPYNGSGDATTCPVWSFTTIVQLPTPAGLSSPANGGANIPITSTLNWTTPVGGGAPTRYKLYLGTNNPPSNMVNGTNLGNVLSYTPASNLSNLTHYYWKIVPFNTAGDASGCVVWDFTTIDILPLSATLGSPPNNGTNISVNPLLSWTPATGGGTATDYLLYLGTNIPPSNVYNGIHLGNVTSYTPVTSLSHNTGYYWKIVPTNGAGSATGCPTWSFTTEMSMRYTVDPPSWNFGNTGIYGMVTKPITITSTGVENLIIYEIIKLTGSSDYYLSGLPPGLPGGTVSVPPGQSVTFNVNYTPSALGQTSAQFRIGTYATAHYLDVNGTGVPNTLPWSCDFTGASPGSIPSGWSQANGTNWYASNTNHAGGTAPEMVLGSSPINSSSPRLISPTLNPTPGTSYVLSFKHMVDWHIHRPNSWLKVESSTDGVNWNLEWYVIPTGDMSATTVRFNVCDLASTPFKLGFSLWGTTADVDNWYIDDISITTFQHTSPSNITLVSPEDDEYILVGNYPVLRWNPPVVGYPEYYCVVLTNDGVTFAEHYTLGSTPYLYLEYIPQGNEIDYSDGSTVYWWVEAAYTNSSDYSISGVRYFTMFDIRRDIQALCYVAWDPVNQSNVGWSTFSLSNPGNITRLSASALPSGDFASGGAWINGTWYGMQCVDNKLWRVNPSNGATTLVGSTGIRFDAITYDQDADILYAVNNNFDAMTSSLYRINYNTAVPTLIGSCGVNGCLITCLAWDPYYDDLYALDIGNDALLKLNQSAGNANMVGWLGADLNYAQDMAFDPDFGNLFLAGYDNSYGGRLYVLDPFNGAAYMMGTLENSCEVDGFVIPGVQHLDTPQVTLSQTNPWNFSWPPVTQADYYTIQSDTDPYGDFSTCVDTILERTWSMNGSSADHQFFRVKAHRGEFPGRGSRKQNLPPKKQVTSGPATAARYMEELRK